MFALYKTQSIVVYWCLDEVQGRISGSKKPADAWRRFNVYEASIRRRWRLIDVETTSWV